MPYNAPAGEYLCIGCVGTYPWITAASDTFSFTKEGTNGIWFGPEGWICSDKPLIGEEGEFTTNSIPEEFQISGAYPNPFNPTTTISYTLTEANIVQLIVYDLSGRQISKLVNGWRDAGKHQAMFDGTNLASGMYIYRITTGEFSTTGKMMLLK